jgi:DNA-binding transcriptional LysR family regulator
MAPTTLTALHLCKTFSAFLAQHDRITLEVALVDLSSNPEEQAFDLAISGRAASYDGVVDVPLCSTFPVLVAAPTFVARQQLDLHHPRELAEQPCLVFAPSGRRWNFQSNRGVVSVEVTPRVLADDNLTLLEAAKLGTGIAVLPRYVASAALRDGSLTALLPQFALQDTWFRAYVPKRRLRIARIQALIDWVQRDLSAFAQLMR